MSGAFWGGFLAVGLGAAVLGLVLGRRLRSWRYSLFGGLHLAALLSKAGEEPEGPKSLNGLDRILLPQILRDFPDFDVYTAKTYAKEYLKKRLSGHDSLHLYQVVISQYLTSQSQKTVVFQAALSWQEGGETVQKRYELHYAYLLPTGNQAVAANCPNCGATLGFGQTTCAYCGSRVRGVMGSSWQFTELAEG